MEDLLATEGLLLRRPWTLNLKLIEHKLLLLSLVLPTLCHWPVQSAFQFHVRKVEARILLQPI